MQSLRLLEEWRWAELHGPSFAYVLARLKLGSLQQ